MDIATLLIGILVGLIVLPFVSHYVRQKGTNLATKEDIDSLTRAVESIRADYAAQSERLKADLSKDIHRYQLQYATELETYREIWSSLVALRHATRDLVERSTTSESNFYDTERTLRSIIEARRPFYPVKVYEELEELLKLIHGQYVDVHYYPKLDEFKFSVAVGHELLITAQIDKLCEQIRRRLEAVAST